MGDLHHRLRAARNYLPGVNQTQLGILAGGMSKDYVMKVESEQGLAQLADYERQTVIAAYSKVTGIPVAWFTADWKQLSSEPTPEQRNNNYAAAIGELRKFLTDAALNGRKDMEEIAGALKEVRRRLSYIEGKLNRGDGA